jgi:putative DNA primase/helicase
MKLQHDAIIDMAEGRHRRETTWKNKTHLWSHLVNKLSSTHRTIETHAEYLAAKKSRQDEIKDIGGFVGGYLDKGRRRKGSVVHRQLVTLDADSPSKGLWKDFKMFYDNAACIYSTHKHTPESPRLRLILPLNREVMPDEYIAIARYIAGSIGIECFDPTTYQPERLMYWPSTSKDAEFVFEYQDGPWIDADAILNSYHDWKDSSEWPMSEKENCIPQREITKQGDPLEKTGIVGAWCRSYSIQDVIETFLSDVYESCNNENRYTYTAGSTGGGLVTYEDKYAYSHHGTDPVCAKLCNAFDLVRIHKFGLKDEDAKEGTPSHKLPSYVAMEDFARKNPEVLKQIGSDHEDRIQHDFAELIEAPQINDEWKKQLEVDTKGKYLSTRNNVCLILENDSVLKGCLKLDSFEHREIVVKELPWREVKKERYFKDSDDASLRIYIEKYYGIGNKNVISDCLSAHFAKNRFHPVKDYLESLSWDGNSRIEKLFIDYLGAEDSKYTRSVTKKMLAAAVARIFEPGCKFDYVLVLVGKQGQKKSMLLDKLGGKWFSDSFTTVQGKEAIEQIQGVWIIEIAELSALRKAEVESIKHYISKREDRYRVAYGRRVENFPRQCVFFATCNNKDFLRDSTGNRRFWPVDTYVQSPSKDPFKDLNEYDISQIWAEAKKLYDSKEPLYLSAEIEEQAFAIQADHSEMDERKGHIESYLNTLLPENWDALDIYKRREWLRDTDELQPAGTKRRDRVCVSEIWFEVLGGQVKDLTVREAKSLHNIMRTMTGWEEYKSKTDIKGYGTRRAYYRKEIHGKEVSAGKNKKENIKGLPVLPQNCQLKNKRQLAET